MICLILLQQGKEDQQRSLDNLSEGSKANERDESAKEANTDNEASVKGMDSELENMENCLELSNAICPVLKMVDNRLLPSKVNITFCADMFPQQSVSNMLIQSPCERKKIMQSSEEALYQVKKKLESLHNVLRTYEIRNSDAAVTERQQESNNGINSICQNVMDTLVSTTTKINNCNERKKSRVSSDAVHRERSDEMQQTVYNSPEQYETDDTGRSSEVSVQKYYNTFTTHLNNEHQCVQRIENENKMYLLNNQNSNVVNDNEIICSTIVCNQIPERVYYTISSGLFEDKDINREVTEINSIKSNMHIENNQARVFPDQQAIPMETDEDLLIVSPTSSRTEISKDSESDDKSTALLLQEALQFKRALLTRIELERICHSNERIENINDQSIPEYDTYSYINNNLQSKILDIISEEQSVSSSTDRTSRSYMYFNIKQDKQLARTSTFNNNINSTQHPEIKDQNAHKGYSDSKDDLESTSEYFSLSNIIPERSSTSNQLSLTKRRCLEDDSTKMALNNLQINIVNHTMDNSGQKCAEIRFTNYLKNINTNINQQKVGCDYVNETEHFDKCILDVDNMYELINPNTESMELFSLNLDETFLDEEEQNTSINEISDFLNDKSAKQSTSISYSKLKEYASLDATLNLLDAKKYTEDNDMLMFSPNLSLKRHPGTCSLIEQTLLTASTEKGLNMHTLIENADIIYELSPSESKENSIETNLLQDSLTSSINQSNESNIPEPPSVTGLTSKFADEEELDLNWSNVKNDFSNDCVTEQNTQTFSTDTITLRKYGSVNGKNYSRQETTCNENINLIEEYETVNIHCEDGKHEPNHSVRESSYTNLLNKESVNEAVHKSCSNLISTHSSLYFTDEASSSTVKLNNAHSKNSEDYLQKNLYTEKSNNQLYCREADPKDTLSSISMSDENKNLVTEIISTQKIYMEALDNRFNIEEELSNSNEESNKNDTVPESCIKNTNVFPMNEIKEALRKENEALNNKAIYSDSNSCNLLSLRNINNGNKTQSNVLICKTESLNINQKILNTSSRQISPKNVKENITTRRMNSTLKSRSQESTPKSEKLTRSVQNVKELKSDLINTRQTKRENNTILKHTKVRDLSAEPRRSAEHNIKLDKKRSRSQISFRTNESSRPIALQSSEFSNNKNSQSSESKLKSQSPVKPLLPTPRTSSKSCIPILKSRLEAARRTENEGRPRSPVRGPLTMTMFWRDNLPNQSPNVMEDTTKVEGNTESNNQCMEERNNYTKRNDESHTYKDDLMKSCIVQNLSENTESDVIQQEPMVIYVNIFTKYDHDTTRIVDPKKFLECIKNRKLNVQKIIKENQSNQKDEFLMAPVEKERSTMHKIVTIVSSIMNGNELSGTSVDLSASTMKSESIINTLSNDKLKQLCFLSVEQREIDVTAKPSVIDTSTSISDLEHVSGTSKSTLNKFQICGTPKELNNDEYVALLEILHQEPNFAHLRELQNVCKQLVSEDKKSK